MPPTRVFGLAVRRRARRIHPLYSRRIMTETAWLIVGAVLAVAVPALVLLAWRLAATARGLETRASEQHREVLGSLHDGLARQSDRLAGNAAEHNERLRATLGEELRQGRETLHALQLALNQSLGESRERMLLQLAETTQSLNTKIEERLGEIAGRVNERLDEGFKKTNETFTNVMTRLATIDEAQKKIETLTGSVVSLQELLGDKRSRGAFGEVQLEALVRNTLPAQAYEMQATLPGNVRVDCLLRLPEPTGTVAIDSKFPLENYHRMLNSALTDTERAQGQRQFKADVKKHVEDIATKYIVPGVTADGAVMFLPAEAVFAEIHAYHRDLVDFALTRRVWIVSPTTMMAVLNTARAVIKDVETRKQVHIIKDELGKLGRDFSRFDERMKKLATHIRQAHEDAQDVETSSRKITQRFQSIERVDLEGPGQPALRVIEGGDERS
jgi:DNA recombination protein RmuC